MHSDWIADTGKSAVATLFKLQNAIMLGEDIVDGVKFVNSSPVMALTGPVNFMEFPDQKVLIHHRRSRRNKVSLLGFRPADGHRKRQRYCIPKNNRKLSNAIEDD